MKRTEDHHIAEFFHRERRTLVARARCLIEDAGDRDAEDLVQDVMLGLFTRGDSGGPLGDLAGYVFRSLKNRVIDIWRGKKPVALPLDAPYGDGGLSLAEVLGDQRFAAGKRLEEAEDLAFLERAMMRLAPAEQQILVATEFEHRPFRDLALEWDIPVGTLLARKKRALDKLKALYASEKEKGGV